MRPPRQTTKPSGDQTLMNRHAIIVAGLLAFAMAPAAVDAAPNLLSNHRDWDVYVFDDGNRRLCYIASEPTQEEGNYRRRGAPAVLVTKLPGSSAAGEVSVQPGYNYKQDSEVEVTVDNNRYRLFTQGNHAWAKTEEDDRAMIEAMRRGINMSVRGTSTLDTYSLDTYSLLGFTAAYDAMSQACRE